MSLQQQFLSLFQQDNGDSVAVAAVEIEITAPNFSRYCSRIFIILMKS